VSFARPNRLTLEYPFTPLHSLSLNQTATKSFRFCLIDRLGNLARLSPPRRAGPLRECLCFGRGAALLGRKPAQPLPPLRRNTFWVHLKQLRQPNEIKKPSNDCELLSPVPFRVQLANRIYSCRCGSTSDESYDSPPSWVFKLSQVAKPPAYKVAKAASGQIC